MNAYALIIYGRPIESFLGLMANVLRVDPFYRAVVHLDISINYADYKGVVRDDLLITPLRSSLPFIRFLFHQY